MAAAAVSRIAWQVHRRRCSASRKPLHFAGRRGNRRALFLTSGNAIAQSQVFPFYFYRRHLAERFDVSLSELRIDRFLGGDFSIDRADIVLVQPWFTLGHAKISDLLELVRERLRPRHVVFLDCHAPTDLRFAEAVDPYVDIYVKKHLLRDLTAYGKPTLGDTNLTDFYARRYGIYAPQTCFRIPLGFLDKIVVGPSFVTADYMLGKFASGRMRSRLHSYDLHARLGVTGGALYSRMREEVLRELGRLESVRCVTGSGVGRARFLSELARSRICLSPFGYGEVAWRDYEAVLSGSLLVKQDMSHVITEPDIFVSDRTYVPIRWDVSDMSDRIAEYLKDDVSRSDLACNAFDVLYRWASGLKFVDQVARLFPVI